MYEDEQTSETKGKEDIICRICMTSIEDDIGVPDCCNHMFCLECIVIYTERWNSCPTDKKNFEEIREYEKKDGEIIQKGCRKVVTKFDDEATQKRINNIIKKRRRKRKYNFIKRIFQVKDEGDDIISDSEYIDMWLEELMHRQRPQFYNQHLPLRTKMIKRNPPEALNSGNEVTVSSCAECRVQIRLIQDKLSGKPRCKVCQTVRIAEMVSNKDQPNVKIKSI